MSLLVFPLGPRTQEWQGWRSGPGRGVLRPVLCRQVRDQRRRRHEL